MIEEVLASWATQADCSRRQVGAVLVLYGEIVGGGRNRLLAGSCTAGDCPRGRTTYSETPAFSSYAGNCAAEHAEVAALRVAGPLARGATAYVSCEPCSWCADALLSAGVVKVIVVPLQSTEGHPTSSR